MATVLATVEVPVGIRATKLLINNRWVDSESGKTFPTINPATGAEICQISEADSGDVEKAVRAARAAFDRGPWRRMSAAERGKLLYRLADLIEKNADELATLEALDNGKPATVARAADLPLTIACYRYYAGWADKIQGKTIPIDGDYFCYTRHEPVGVVGQIIPWNFPLLMQAWKLGPALASGYTVVLKPAEQTPLTALRVARLLLEAGFPDGVVNMLPGYGPTAGAAIADTWTSTRSRSPVQPRSGTSLWKRRRRANLKRVTLELGGKSPNIVFADADLDAGRRRGPLRPVLQSGPVLLCRQSSCSSKKAATTNSSRRVSRKAKRRKCRRSVRRQDRTRPAGGPGAVRQGDGLYRGRQAARREDACGRRVALATRGYFIEPTVFADVKDDMKIGQEEIFGPVMSILSSRISMKSSTGQHDVLWPGRRRLDPRHQARPMPSRMAFEPARSGSTATTSSTRPRRSAASSSPALAANLANTDYSNTPKSKRLR